MSRRPVVRAVVAFAAVLTLASLAASTADARRGRILTTPPTAPLSTGVFDPFLFGGPQEAQAFDMIKGAGGTYVRLLLRWYSVAPAVLPAGFDASDPNSVGYDWASIDASVAAAETAGLTPILDIDEAPSWAFPIPPSGGSGGSPNIGALGAFAKAMATHYDGNHGAPAVHVFQVWNEPNFSRELDPVDPVYYRNMVNAVAASVHAVDPANLVVAGDLDPFENATQQWHTMAPLAFMRKMLCVSPGSHPHATCKAAAHFDVWSHHPYTFQGPFGHAKLPDDVSLGDLPKMNALLQTGIGLQHVVSSQPVQFWVTEFSWDTNPPRRSAAPADLEARWTAEAFHQMWLSGVSAVTWFMLQDLPATSPYQSGLYFYSPLLDSAQPKPMYTAFHFPFVAYLGKRGVVSVWGRDATSSVATVAVQQRHGTSGTWKTVALIRTNRYGIFLANLKLKKANAKDWLRASAPGSGTALPFSLTRPSPKIRFGPWGNP